MCSKEKRSNASFDGRLPSESLRRVAARFRQEQGVIASGNLVAVTADASPQTRIIVPKPKFEGPLPLTAEQINAVVTRKSPGNFALDKTNDQGRFLVAY